MKNLKHKYITTNDENGRVNRVGIILFDHGEGRLTVEWIEYLDMRYFVNTGSEPDTKTIVFEQCQDFDLMWRDDYDLHYTWYTAAGRFIESEKEREREVEK